MDLKKYFDYVLDNYLLPENLKFSSEKEYYKVIVNYIPGEIIRYLGSSNYSVSGSCGKGTRSSSPYVAIMNNKITSTTQKGIYVDFIFKSDMSGFYLTIDQGIKNIKEEFGNKKSSEIARQAAVYFRKMISDFKGFEIGLVSGHVKKGSLEEGYENTRVIAKYYDKDNYTNDELIEDLKNIMEIYDEITEKMNGLSYDEIVKSINKSFSWESVYKEIAVKVLEFKNNHQALIDLMYEILSELGLFNDNDEKNCNLDNVDGVRCRYDDFDPFSFMNRLDIYKNENRKGFIKLFQNKTGLEEKIPDNFDGIPSVNPQSSCFIRFKNDNRTKDVKDYWNLFEIAIKYSQNQSDSLRNEFIKYYDECISKPGCSFNLTMGLFRIDPNFYINLDSTNRQFIKKEFNIDITKCPNGEKYLSILNDIKKLIADSEKYESMIDFSKNAWINKIDSEINYWTYSPGEGGSEWDYCFSNKKMVLGWDMLGSLDKYNSRDEISNALIKKYNKMNPYNDIGCVYNFKFVLKPGDIVIAKVGQSKILGYGEVIDNNYYYDNSRAKYKNCRNVNWIKKGEWSITPDIRVAQKALTNITPYGDFSRKILSLIGENDDMNSNINEWIIPANPKFYDHAGAFEKNGFIDWTQNVNFNIGDIVYIYSTMPEERIAYKAIVEKINLSEDETVDDSEFVLTDDISKKRSESSRYVRLKLQNSIHDDRLKYGELAKNGLWGRPQRAAHLSSELSKYVHYVLNSALYEEDEVLLSANEIYYGGPGCGKSKLVENTYCKGDNFIRTTFYPDYTNSDFVGQLIPFYNKEKEKLEYIINPGPFTKAYEKALKNPNRNIYLIIEEINRGNAAAIFGDIFQLLDRVTDISVFDQGNKHIGESEYEISNSIIENYILESCGIDLVGKIKIPANMSIIATMNTSDQNVYTLDSAFKRRWKMIHISNSFENKDYDLKIGPKYVPMLNCDITWMDFVNRINNAIIDINTFGINSEDKQIGKYFVGTADLLESKVEEYDNIEDASKKFAEKVLMYLWEDIAKLEPTEWFNNNIKTLDSLLENYQKTGIKVFSENLQNILKTDSGGNLDEEDL